jgi:hypothetical protein
LEGRDSRGRCKVEVHLRAELCIIAYTFGHSEFLMTYEAIRMVQVVQFAHLYPQEGAETSPGCEIIPLRQGTFGDVLRWAL